MFRKISCTALILCAAFASAIAAEVFKIDSTSTPPENSNVTKTDAGFVFKPDSTWNIPNQPFDGQAGSFEIDLVPDFQPLDAGMKRRINAICDINGSAHPGIVINQYSDRKMQLLNFTIFNSSKKAFVAQKLFDFVPGREYKIKAQWDREKITLSVNGQIINTVKLEGTLKSNRSLRLRPGAVKGNRTSLPMTLKRFVFTNSK